MRNSVFRISPTQEFIPNLAAGIFARYSVSELAETKLFLPSYRLVKEFENYWRQGKFPPIAAVEILASVDEEDFHADHENSSSGILSRQDMRLLVHRFFLSAGKADPAMVSSFYQLLVLLERQEISLKEIAERLQNLPGAAQNNLPILQVILKNWRAVLADMKLVSWVENEQEKLKNLLVGLQKERPENPIIIAGSSGSIDCVFKIMQFVATLEKGSVIFVAPEIPVDDEYYDAIDIFHPLFGVKKFLSDKKTELKIWHGELNILQKEKELAALEVSVPADLSDRWVDNKISAAAISATLLLQCENSAQEEILIEKLLFDARAEGKKNLAVIAPDRNFRQNLEKFLGARGVLVGKCSGRSVLEYLPIKFMLSVLDYVEKPSAVSLLSLLNHPLCMIGCDAQFVRNAAAWFELKFLRKKNISLEKEALILQLQKNKKNVEEEKYSEFLIKFFAIIAENFSEHIDKKRDLHNWLKFLESAASALSVDKNSVVKLWQEEEKIYKYWQDFKKFAHLFDALALADLKLLLNSLWQKISLPDLDNKTEVFVWLMSPVEARLLKFDFVILANMNEGCWPVVADSGPWLSRKDFSALSLDCLERVIGQSWADALFFMMNTECVLTRAEKENSNKKRPSRIFQRLKILQLIAKAENNNSVTLYQNYLTNKFLPPKIIAEKTEAKISVSERPRDLSASALALLLSDPYGYYARYVLRLRKIEELDAVYDARDFGNILHRILEEILIRIPDFSQHVDVEKIKHLAKEILLRELKNFSALAYWWWPRIERIMHWYAEKMAENSQNVAMILSEYEITAEIIVQEILYKISARADRLEYEKNTQAWCLIDFKTGNVPSEKDIEYAKAPQMAIMAWILARNKQKISTEITRAEFWELKGKSPAGQIQARKSALDLENTANGIFALLEYFSHEDAIYRAVPNPNLAPSYNDYAHLER